MRRESTLYEMRVASIVPGNLFIAVTRREGRVFCLIKTNVEGLTLLYILNRVHM
jgi:hypothetical protein